MNMYAANLKLFRLSLAGLAVIGAATQPAASQNIPIDQMTSTSQQQVAQKSADGPSAFYHLVYTLTESDGPKRLGNQRFVLTVSSNREAGSSQLKVGSKVPVSTSPKNSTTQQITFVDVGLTIQVRTQRAFSGGLEVFSDVEQSSIAVSPDEKILDPLIRNSNLRGTAVLYPDKPVSLGAFDVPGSTRHYEVQVTMQAIH